MEYPEEFKKAFAEVVDTREEIQTIEEWLQKEHPAEMERLQELKAKVPQLTERLKDQIRSHGSDGSYLGYSFSVQHKFTMEVDEVELLEKAREREEIGALLDIGLIKYAVNPVQLERMDGEMKAVYCRFISKTPMTPAVTLPKSLK